MKDLITKINETAPLAKERVDNALKAFDVLMEKSTQNFKRQQAEGEILARKAYFTK